MWRCSISRAAVYAPGILRRKIAVSGLGPDDLFLEVRLWGRRSEALAVESLYEAE